MLKNRKQVLLFTSIFLMIFLSVEVVFCDSTVIAPNVETRNYTHIDQFVNSLSINDYGCAQGSSYMSASTADEVKVIGYVQEYINGSWVNIASETSRVQGTYTGVGPYKYVNHGSYYRYVSYCFVYVGGIVVDSDYYVSSTRYY